MLDIDYTFLWTFVNFIVLYVILNFVLFKPLGKHMRARSEKIASDIETAQKQKSEGEVFRLQYEKQLMETIEERRKILDETNMKAARSAEVYIENAKKEAVRILEEGRVAVQREHDAMIGELKNEVASIAIAAASKVIEEDADSEKNRRFVESFLERTSVE
ncbi:ATP synthase subunit b [Clostridia bacterium]|nr:ATP synthase subunit b [Clostridia bacterium]